MQQFHSPCENVKELTVPLIAINAADDPFSPADGKRERERERERDRDRQTDRQTDRDSE